MRVKYATREEVILEPLPCWKHLSPETHRERIADLVSGIEEEAAAERERTGVTPPGPAAVCAKHPHDRPNRVKKSHAPLFHAATRRVRDELYQICTPPSWPPSATRPRSCEPATCPWSSRLGASRPPCRGSVDNR